MISKNIYIKETSRGLRNLLLWSSVVVFLTLTTLAMFPYMKGMGESMESMMKMFPQGMLKAFGIDPKMWSSILGLYNTYFGFYLILLMGIYTGTNGANALSKGQRDKTAEFLLTKPISRREVFLSKMIVVITLLLLIVCIQAGSAILGIVLFGEKEVDWSVFFTMHLHGLVLLFFYTSVGVLLSTLLKSKINFMGIIVGLVFGAYFLDAISKAVQQVKWLGYLSPNHYLHFNIFAPDYGPNVVSIVFFTLLSILLIVSSYLLYRRKDIDS